MKNKNSKSNSGNAKNLSETKSVEIESTNVDSIENLIPCKKEVFDPEGSDVEYIDDSNETVRLLDYIILDDDDDDDDPKPNKQLTFDTNGELQLKCEVEEVEVKEENICLETESISSSENQIEKNPAEAVSDDKVKDTITDVVDAAPPKEEGGTEKSGDSLVLTLDEKELGEISETVEPKCGPNEGQSMTQNEDTSQNTKPNENEIENILSVSSSENETTKADTNDATPSDNSQKVKSNTIESIPKSRVVWVSNLKRSVKATDLKHHLNKFGKVITTKIVTDGRRCFGYVVFESCKDAANCISNLNDSEYDGAKITLATNKPVVEIKNKPKEDEKLKTPQIENNDNNNKKRNERKSKTIPKISKRRRSLSTDPLTTKFDDKSSSRTKDDRIEREYLREKQEKERLKRRLAEEMRRSREEMNRLREKEEKQRQRELKLELERKKLRMEKEMLERERREMMQLEEEKRKIEKEKINLMRQKLEMEKSIRDSKRKVTPEKDERKAKKRRAAGGNFNFDKFDIARRRNSSEPRDEGRYSNIRKSKDKKQTSSFYRDSMSKTTRHDKNVKHQTRRDEKDFLCVPPSPPKLSNDFDIPKRKQAHDIIHSYNRKSSCASPSSSSSKQNHHSYRKIDFDKPKIPPPPPPPRRDERSIAAKSSDHYGHSGKVQRMSWNSSSTVSSPWKMNSMGSQSPGTGFSANRFPAVNYSGTNCNSSRFPQPTFYNPQSINLPPPDYKYYFNHDPSSRKY